MVDLLQQDFLVGKRALELLFGFLPLFDLRFERQRVLFHHLHVVQAFEDLGEHLGHFLQEGNIGRGEGLRLDTVDRQGAV